MSTQEELDPLNTELSLRVDKLMELEIRRFHASNVSQNAVRWDSLCQKLDKDRQKDAARHVNHNKCLRMIVEKC